MDVRGYEFKISEQLWSYEFYSEGPKGRIRKLIQYLPFNFEGRACFNLFLGDWNEEKKLFDDLTTTNNEDSLKVLITVAKTVLEFTNSFPDAIVHIKGSTPSRTRLYQIGITNNWHEISPLFNVYGYTTNNQWQLFLKNVNYNAFIVYRKKNVYL
jgi:hypothetical protein